MLTGSLLLLGAFGYSALAGKAGPLKGGSGVSPRQLDECNTPGWIPVCPGDVPCIPPTGTCCTGEYYHLPGEECPDGYYEVPRIDQSNPSSASITPAPSASSTPSTTFVDYSWYTYSYTYYYYYYYYYHTDATYEITSTGTTYYTTFSFTATDEAAAESVYESATSAIDDAAPTQSETPTLGSVSTPVVRSSSMMVTTTANLASSSEDATPIVEKRRRQSSVPQKKTYIDAILCLSHTKAKSGIPAAVNRFDDHQAVHMPQKPQIHWVDHFLLWHRYFTATYEKALRDIPEASRPSPDTGCSGTDQQYWWRVCDEWAVRPSSFYGEHANSALFEEVLAQPDYTSTARTVEKKQSFDPPNIHASGHFGVSGILGTMGNAAKIPGDPLFYLHHGNMDRIFCEWQQKDLGTRLSQVGGPVMPFDYSGRNITLDFTVKIGALAGDATLKDLLNTEGGMLYYTY
ncbi:hypothetical protein G6011_01718 [Alternaria panax]|uniref:Tyrosinase copper-binding domain-containing protein n=1 Tax=Alternaria panax TaxID=48097 RepID=A0AAD4NVT9_9PLEO|nr:hypothetical protein G6011_01718 [Alternaria panax]